MTRNQHLGKIIFPGQEMAEVDGVQATETGESSVAYQPLGEETI
jgi:hypothetical protein